MGGCATVVLGQLYDAGQNGATRSATAKCEILLVEDHESSATITATVLRSFGHNVTVVGSVASALEQFEGDRQNPIDLVISDLGLPDGSGENLLQRLLARRPIKAIVVSGYGMESDVQKSAAAGFMAHLTKPINVTQLREAIARTLELESE